MTAPELEAVAKAICKAKGGDPATITWCNPTNGDAPYMMAGSWPLELSAAQAALSTLTALGWRKVGEGDDGTIDEGELAECLERAERDIPQMPALSPSPQMANMLARHALTHLRDVRREFAERRAMLAALDTEEG